MDTKTLFKVLFAIIVLTAAAVSSAEGPAAPIRLYIDRIEEGFAVLLTHEGIDLTVPASLLLPELSEGQAIELGVSVNSTSSADMEASMKTLMGGFLKEPD